MPKKVEKFLYFAYGSNLEMDQMSERCPESRPVCKAILYGYLMKFRGSSFGVATVEKKEDSCVYGAIYEVTKKDIRALDVFEGYPSLYTRKKVKVVTENGCTQEVFVYVMVRDYDIRFPSRKYYDTIRRGYEHWGYNTEPLQDALSRAVLQYYGFDLVSKDTCKAM